MARLSKASFHAPQRSPEAVQRPRGHPNDSKFDQGGYMNPLNSVSGTIISGIVLAIILSIVLSH